MYIRSTNSGQPNQNNHKKVPNKKRPSFLNHKQIKKTLEKSQSDQKESQYSLKVMLCKNLFRGKKQLLEVNHHTNSVIYQIRNEKHEVNESSKKSKKDFKIPHLLSFLFFIIKFFKNIYSWFRGKKQFFKSIAYCYLLVILLSFMIEFNHELINDLTRSSSIKNYLLFFDRPVKWFLSLTRLFTLISSVSRNSDKVSFNPKHSKSFCFNSFKDFVGNFSAFGDQTHFYEEFYFRAFVIIFVFCTWEINLFGVIRNIKKFWYKKNLIFERKIFVDSTVDRKQLKKELLRSIHKTLKNYRQFYTRNFLTKKYDLQFESTKNYFYFLLLDSVDIKLVFILTTKLSHFKFKMFVSNSKGILERNIFNQIYLDYIKIYEEHKISFKFDQFKGLIPKEKTEVPSVKLPIKKSQTLNPKKASKRKSDSNTRVTLNLEGVDSDELRKVVLYLEDKLNEALKYYNDPNVWKHETTKRYNTNIHKLKKNNGNIVRKSELITEISSQKLFETIDDFKVTKKWQKSVSKFDKTYFNQKSAMI